MSIRFVSLSAVVVMLAFQLPVPAAHAASPEFCRQYAQAALNQARGGRSQPGCRGAMDGDRWSMDFRVHYDWCLGHSPEAAESERGIRTGFLESCRR
jgi:hypothetical protein